MAVTIAVRSAWGGYSYFMKSVGAGVESLGSAELGRRLVGSLVTEEQMARLAGKGMDPVTGEQVRSQSQTRRDVASAPSRR